MDKNKSLMVFVDNGSNERNHQALAMRMRNQNSRNTSPEVFETENIYSRPNYGIEIEDLEPTTTTTVRYNNNNNNNNRSEDDDDDKTLDNGLMSSRPLSPRTPSTGVIPQHALPPSSAFDVNVYQQKKTLAQGMMDLALLSANANQLRYVLSSRGHPFFLASLIMISMSLALQIVVGIGLIWNSRYDVREDADVHQANRANNWTVVGIFLVTILNVFISSFGVIDQPSDVVSLPFRSVNGTDDPNSLRSLNSTLTSNITDITETLL